MRRSLKAVGHWIATLITAGALGACAIIPGPQGGGGGTAVSSKTLLFAAAENQDSNYVAAKGAVEKVLVARGYRFAADGRFEIALGLAKRPVEIGFQAAPSPGRQEQAPYPAALPEDRRLDLCREAVYRLSVVIVSRVDNTVAYRGAAEEVRCGDLSDRDLTGLANVALGSMQ